MTAVRWSEVMDVFSAVADRSLDDQRTYLDEVCAHDSDLRMAVEELLISDALAETEEFLQEPPWVIDEIPVFLPDFEDYRHIEYIGHGGMGVVYKAFDQSLDTQVALKLILPRRLMTAEDVSRFRIDPRSMAKLKHPNIVQVHTVGECNGRPYFTMNLIERRGDSASLQKHLTRFRDDPIGAAKLMIKVARAVHHAHQRGILHRDLKPANILLDGEGNPYITDFGLAQQIGQDAPRTETGKPFNSASGAQRGAVGTAMYMSPEQADPSPDKEVTTVSDVYGLGATLYALLTGQPPFRGATVAETLQVVRDIERQPERPSQRAPWVDRTLEEICLKCLHKDPDRRYRSAEGLAKDLERWLRHERTDVAQPLRVRAWNWCRRNPGGAILAAAAVMLVIFSILMTRLASEQMGSSLKESVGRSNRRAAERVADSLRWRLRNQAQTVVDLVATDKHVRDLLKRMAEVETREDVHQFLKTNAGLSSHEKSEALFDSCNQALAKRGIPKFATMFFLNKDGRLVDHAGHRGRDMNALGELFEEMGRPFDQRDYFIKARQYTEQGKRGMDAVHISRVFKSKYDEYFKFAISMPVLDEHDSFIGVVEASIPMDDRLGLERSLLHSEDQKIVLAGRVDPRPARAGGDGMNYMDCESLILLHEAFAGEDKEELRKTPFAIGDRLVSEWPSIVGDQSELDSPPLAKEIEPDDDYRDPLGKTYATYSGRWVAGFGQVGNTELMVIVQEKYEHAIDEPTSLAARFVLWGWGALAIAFILAGAFIWYRSRPAFDTARN